MGHFLDLDTRALGLFRIPLALAALSLFLGPLALPHPPQEGPPPRRQPSPGRRSLRLPPRRPPRPANLRPRPLLRAASRSHRPTSPPQDLIVIHGEYESGSTLAFYLQRPASYAPQPNATNFIHILEGRSSNLWYGSFFPDAPPIFETPTSIAAKWPGPQRIFLWQSLTDPPNQLPALPGPVYILVKSGGKEIVSNQPNR